MSPRIRALVTIATLALTTTLALPSAAADPDDEETDSTNGKPRTRPNTVPIVVGSIILGVSQAIPFGIAAEHDFANQGGWFAAPVAGPWLYLATRDGCGDGKDLATTVCGFGDTMLVLTVVADGLVQLMGAALVIGGLASPIREDPKTGRLLITPSVVATPAGDWVPGVVGRF